MRRPIILLGYSGHAYEIIEICRRSDIELLGYCEAYEKSTNPYQLRYLGFEKEDPVIDLLSKHDAHVAIGANKVRALLQQVLKKSNVTFRTIIDPAALISESVMIGEGSMIGKGATMNALAKIGSGVICNTGSIIEHECKIGDFSHIGPGATLCGGVEIGARTMVGAGAVIIPNIQIGSDVIIGANSLVNRNVTSGKTVVGNPSREI